MVFLYRRPILDYWAEHEETLGAIVTHVLVHEIGHHFGLSDADMEHIEAEAARVTRIMPLTLAPPRPQTAARQVGQGGRGNDQCGQLPVS